MLELYDGMVRCGVLLETQLGKNQYRMKLFVTTASSRHTKNSVQTRFTKADIALSTATLR